MKKQLLILFLFLSATIHAQQTKLIGEWTNNKQHGKKVSLVFDADGSAVFSGKEHHFGGEHNFGDGKTLAVKYEVDHTKSPHRVDFVFYVKETGEIQERIRGIYQLLKEDKVLLLRIGLTGSSYSAFSNDPDDPDTFILERKGK